MRKAILIIDVGVLEAYSAWDSVHVLSIGSPPFKTFVSSSGLRESENLQRIQRNKGLEANIYIYGKTGL